MKKSIFVSLGILSLLVVGGASFALSANRQEFKEAKADGDTVAVTLNFNSFRTNSGNANAIDLKFTPENDIPTGWNVAPITQVSRDAFWLNGVPTQDDGNAVIQKQSAYNYEICIDAINYSKYHDTLQAGDVVLIQGKWQAVYETTTYDVTVTPLYVRFTGSGWERLETYDIYLNLSIDQGRKNNKDELYFTPTAENPIPHNGWDVRTNSSANECFSVNGVSASVQTQLIKVLEYTYLVYTPDTGFTIAADDVVKLQGIYTYSTPLLSFHVHVNTQIVKWTGTEWIESVENASASDLPAASLLNNIGGRSGTKCSLKNFDQTPETLEYKKDANGNTGYYFTSSAGAKSEVRFYLPDNAYKAETKGYALRSVTFDYMLTNTDRVNGTEVVAGLTPDGFYLKDVPASTTTPYMIQLMDNYSWENGAMAYYGFNVDLQDDGKLHTYTLNVAYSDITGINFCLFKFKGTFFISNLQVDYNAYDADLNTLVADKLKMYAYHDYNKDNKCLTYYADAKAAYLALSADQKTLFGTDTAYGSARARLAAWADANGDVFDAAAGTITAKANMRLFNGVDNQNSIAIIIAIAMSSSVVLLGVLLVLKKKHKYN